MQAGFTFNYETKVTITNEGFKIISENRESVVKHRLGRNTADIAILSNETIKQLEFNVVYLSIFLFFLNTRLLSSEKKVGKSFGKIHIFRIFVA